MIRYIFNLFDSPQLPKLSSNNSRLALAALLVRLARTDDKYQQQEIDAIINILQKRYSIDNTKAEALYMQAEQLERQSPDTVHFTRAIKRAVPYENRTEIIEALWEVVLVDGTRDYAENSILRTSADLLGISDIDSARVRQRVHARLQAKGKLS